MTLDLFPDGSEVISFEDTGLMRKNIGRRQNKVSQTSGRAAQYVRMSTDHQKYSIDNQEELIAAYAAVHNITIVQKYADSGKSGLRLEGRDALRQLIDDIQNGPVDFNIVLVYDVSRWGRFQDVDESAYYEFICKRAGVALHYCAEQFANDGSLIATIIKGMKRAMAAEFSRELSVKVLEGQKRLSQLGFCRGGTPGYGLRRMLVDENRRPKGILEFGQEKNLQSDRVILVAGPPQEVEMMRNIFRMFVHDRIPPSYIAKILNEKKVLNAWGNPWTTNNVFKLLKNESYIGNLVYNRTTARLQSNRRPNPSNKWIRAEGVFEKVLDPELFKAAQVIFNSPWTYTDNELLDYLTAMLCVNGRITAALIYKRKCGPSITTYYYRFGCLSNAYRAVGYFGVRSHTFTGDAQYQSKRPKRTQWRGYKIWKHSDFRYRA
jgi:DNA invertase Pin-like site-specific DNA recombinase